MKRDPVEFEQLVKMYGKEKAMMMLAFASKHKGKRNEIKRTALHRTLRTSKDIGGDVGNRG